MKLGGRPEIHRWDVVLVGALIAVGQAEAWTGQAGVPPWAHALGSAVMALALLWRRQTPLVVLAIATLGNSLINFDGQAAPFVIAVIATYNVGAEAERRPAQIALALVLAAYIIPSLFGDEVYSDVAAAVVLFGGSWTLGRLVRERGRSERRAADRAERAERERDEQAERVAAAERARIARELHDVVAHSISLMAVQAQVLQRRTPPEQEERVAELRSLELTAREAMGEMRRLFGVLRADGNGAPTAPQPGLDQLGELADRARESGLRVELRLPAEPPALPPGIDLGVYRIVQEALTNVRKHAGPGTAVRVAVAVADGVVDIEVEDDGPGPPAEGDADTDAEPGHGLIGMRERVALYGGRLEVGGGPSGGFRVHAAVPVEAEAVAGYPPARTSPHS